jgi:hypothetical protein
MFVPLPQGLFGYYRTQRFKEAGDDVALVIHVSHFVQDQYAHRESGERRPPITICPAQRTQEVLNV